jgi:hypothetical protein
VVAAVAVGAVVLAVVVLVARTVVVVARTRDRPAVAQARGSDHPQDRTDPDPAAGMVGGHTAPGVAATDTDHGAATTAGTDGDTTHTPTAHPGKVKAPNHPGGGGGHS